MNPMNLSHEISELGGHSRRNDVDIGSEIISPKWR
jgi:hypothetical protein